MNDLVDPETLYRYARRYRLRNGDCPTFSQVKKRFGWSYDQIEGLIDSYEGEHCLCMIVAMQYGSGVYEFKTRGEYQVEAT